MFPIVGIPETIRDGLAPYRDLFCRGPGFDHVSRYLTGLILCPDKTLQGIYDRQVWGEEPPPSRRAMHAAVFEAGWNAEGLMPRHREVIGPDHRGRGREVLSLDWTYAHHDRGPKIWGVNHAWDHVEKRYGLYQTVVTAGIANRHLIDGIAMVVQVPHRCEQEMTYLKETVQTSYEQMEDVQTRLLELFHHWEHRLAYKKRTEIALEIVQQLEAEGHFPQSAYAFDNGLLNLPLTRYIEQSGKHWVSNLESSRHIQWQGQWRRVDDVAAELRRAHPESFRQIRVRGRNGETSVHWVFTKVVRLKRYGRKRVVIVHDREQLDDAPRFLVTDALHWESGRVLETWSYRWAIELFHEFGKQETGLEAAQVRKEEAVKRHFHLSCVAQSLLQRVDPAVSTSERFAFARGKSTVGQKTRAIMREAFDGLLQFVASLLARGYRRPQILDMVMPV